MEGLEEAGQSCEIGDGIHSSLPEGMTAGREAALLLGYLERLGEPYGPPEVTLVSRCPLLSFVSDGQLQNKMVRS